MTKPPNPLFNHSVSDVTGEADLTSPAISISSSSNGRYEAANQNIGYTEAGGASTAYATNPTSDTALGSSFHSQSTHPTIVVQDTDSLQYFVQHGGSRREDVSTSDPTPGGFGSQIWEPPPGPFLDFAPQPIYEPLGELADEQIQSFHEFDSPSSIRSSASLSQNSSTTRPDLSAKLSAGFEATTATNVFAPPTLPRSALKRKAEHDITPSIDTASTRGLHSAKIGDGKRRSVSFERMSASNSRSPGDASAGSDNLLSQRTSQGGHTSAASRGRSRQSTSSTPRPTVNIPSAASQSQARGGRGTRVPSATPPSILPPEKVFPIRIGSDLFQLSGASISSDGQYSSSLCQSFPDPLQHRRISPNSSRNNFARTKILEE